MKSFLISGDCSGAGKTTVTLGIAASLAKKSSVQTFKVAMDYIDTSYLSGVTGRCSYNLDTYVQTDEQMFGLFSFASKNVDIGIVEGVRGLFEGSDAFSDTGSTASVAKKFHLPVILVLNARSITRSAAAIIKGFQVFDSNVKISGIILNNVGSSRHVEKAKQAIEYYCGIPVLGAIPRCEDLSLPERHLGLVPYREGITDEEFQYRLENIISVIEENVNLDAVKELAEDITPHPNKITKFLSQLPQKTKRIGVAYDEAFNFYYGELSAVLSAQGCEVIYFSPIHDSLPDCDGYVFGGGYPELFAKELFENAAMREDVQRTVNQNIPVYAECGGLMYLCRNIKIISDYRGSSRGEYSMCNVYDGIAQIPEKKVLGYVSGTADMKRKSYPFSGHEFHYSSVSLKNAEYVYKLSRGTGIKNGLDGAKMKNCIASYTHLMPLSSTDLLSSILF